MSETSRRSGADPSLGASHPGLFSLGGLLARWWRREPVWIPWALAALALVAGGSWDFVIRAGRLDFILLGLAGYELVIGLTEEAPTA